MKNFVKKYKILIVIMAIFLAIFALDIIIWRLDVNSNKKIIKDNVAGIAVSRKIATDGIYEACRVSVNKSFKTTSCSIKQDVIISPSTDMKSELASVFTQLNGHSWDANFEVFKEELLEGESRFDDQSVRFYHNNYDPNGDHDFIDVFRVDNGVTLKDTGIQSSGYGDADTNLIVLRFHQYQRSSLSHYIIGQFKNF